MHDTAANHYEAGPEPQAHLAGPAVQIAFSFAGLTLDRL
jgi:hypothetical protein